MPVAAARVMRTRHRTLSEKLIFRPCLVTPCKASAGRHGRRGTVGGRYLLARRQGAFASSIRRRARMHLPCDSNNTFLFFSFSRRCRSPRISEAVSASLRQEIAPRSEQDANRAWQRRAPTSADVLAAIWRGSGRNFGRGAQKDDPRDSGRVAHRPSVLGEVAYDERGGTQEMASRIRIRRTISPLGPPR
ncbi:hypothetical protein TcCL_ESM06675 [Trypanosoma cruzi]|nr:hypothetical protein TcCL_ESM06675 [Trypanosoma cruzi]